MQIKMVKTVAPKALIMRINFSFIAVFLIVYATLLLWLSSDSFENGTSLVQCSMHECYQRGERSFKMKALLEEPHNNKSTGTKIEVPRFIRELGKGTLKIGMVNMDEEDVSEWRMYGETTRINFERVSPFLKWKELYPEWIDEDEKYNVPTCPEIPMAAANAKYGEMEVIVAKLPCKYPEEGWRRDVFRLQVHLVVANVAVKKGKKDQRGKTKVVFRSNCRPMLELFPCEDLVKQDGKWWYYEVQVKKLEHQISSPVGSCKLTLPEKNVSSKRRMKREAYATVLHSSEAYVCGAITLAQSLLQTATKRDLVLLADNSISLPKRHALAQAGWKIRTITRIRNPKSKKGSYNEYNYSKFRLWQLTDYDKVIFIDSDIIVLRSLDILFHFPQLSAAGNDQSMFNSGLMVIEPSNCTFRTLMSDLHDIVSYNGGDQGFLNEVFVWWHRLPRRMNVLKIFKEKKHDLFESETTVFGIHYLGWKPWQCYREYDCNWDSEQRRVYASDVLHRAWWKLHDGMDEKLQRFCTLSKRRRSELSWVRRKIPRRDSNITHWADGFKAQ